MRAIYFEEHGGPEVLKFGDLPDPEPGRGEVLMEVRAASLNHLDLFVRRGMPGFSIEFPHIPGSDASGVVAGLGEDVGGFEAGDRVLLNPSLSCGKCEYCIRGDASLCRTYHIMGETVNGTCCEKIVVPAENVIKIPAHISFEAAAAVPLVFLTAWRMLITRAALQPGEDVLILGAASGVGTACIQIAKRAGARVFAAASSEEKLELCRRLGADVVINYAEEDFVKRIKSETNKKGVDVCVDYIGKDTWVNSLKSLARGGRLVTCGATTGYDPQTDLRHIFFRQLQIIGSTMGSKNDLLAPLQFLFRGEIKAAIDRVMDLEETAEAHRLMESRSVAGKIVLRVGDKN
ncbi:MAG: zinc-binding dehydrogenase [Candidatus Latescibacteria bacterium]|nr:zinc-binding dehydrogenase [Candidatus Latescibacterota bacterium]NIO00961.1 zinc-binding dehydrogenase [Candidatus Latescibacterota bacterium]NIO27360.1 zinc-binding dehydrogenase [Candidatus Latescibacterota bacterium]NIO54882.1 zinc-binding dehydrogenase [Candidatus Latescibacterota bacterium]NIT00971.1 zinc-binding dehydrogenase [Candidatus Latescibacterota bacterium]